MNEKNFHYNHKSNQISKSIWHQYKVCSSWLFSFWIFTYFLGTVKFREYLIIRKFIFNEVISVIIDIIIFLRNWIRKHWHISDDVNHKNAIHSAFNIIIDTIFNLYFVVMLINIQTIRGFQWISFINSLGLRIMDA